MSETKKSKTVPIVLQDLLLARFLSETLPNPQYFRAYQSIVADMAAGLVSKVCQKHIAGEEKRLGTSVALKFVRRSERSSSRPGMPSHPGSNHIDSDLWRCDADVHPNFGQVKGVVGQPWILADARARGVLVPVDPEDGKAAASSSSTKKK